MKLLNRMVFCVNATSLCLCILIVFSMFMAESFGVDMGNEAWKLIVSIIFIPINIHYIIECWPRKNKI